MGAIIGLVPGWRWRVDPLEALYPTFFEAERDRIGQVLLELVLGLIDLGVLIHRLQVAPECSPFRGSRRACFGLFGHREAHEREHQQHDTQRDPEQERH